MAAQLHNPDLLVKRRECGGTKTRSDKIKQPYRHHDLKRHVKESRISSSDDFAGREGKALCA